MGKMRNDCSKGIVLFWVILNVVSTFTLASIVPSAHAEDSVVTTTAITISESCSMTSTVNTPHNATVINGTYSGSSYPNGIGQTTLKAFCNDNAGFAIYAIGFTDDEYGNTKLHSSTLDSTYDINTGIYDSGSASSSTWSMKLTSVSGTYAPTIADGTNGLENFTTWHAVPSTYTKVAYRTSGTDVDYSGSGIGSSLTTTYDAYVSATQPAGTYVGQVKYTLVHPSNSTTPAEPKVTEADKICYYPNGGNVEGTMGCQSITSSDTSAILLASNYSRKGYGFAGWSTTYDYQTTDENAHFYGPQETITFTAGQFTGTNNGLSLYAYWVKSAGNLQGWTGCSSMASGAVTALTDQRDGETYAVAKLADGNCWMIENMRLKNTNFDNTTGDLAQGYDATFAGLADPEEPSLFNDVTTANSLYSVDGSTGNTLFGGNRTQRFPRYNNVNTPTAATDRPIDPTSNSATNSTSNASMYSYGNYYTWAAVIADTNRYDSDNQSITTTSICPSGWHLPKGGDKTNEANNEFWALIVTGINNGVNPANYDSNDRPSFPAGPVEKALRAYPNNFVYSGNIYGGSITNRGLAGRYWSSSGNNSRNAYLLTFDSGGVHPGTDRSDKYYGRSIRCVTSGL